MPDTLSSATVESAEPPGSVLQGAPIATTETMRRVEHTLEAIDDLWELVEADDQYRVPPLGYELPADFKLSVVIPVYNEKRTVFELLARVQQLPVTKEIIVVDDCSTDGTRGWLETLRGAPGLKLIFKQRNRGKGAAVRTGFFAASGSVVVVQDADLEYDPRDILKVIQPIVRGEAEVVYGSRYLGCSKRDRGFLHRLVNRTLTATSNLFTGLGLSDMETCHKAFHPDVIRGLELRQNRFGFEPEVTAKLARRGVRIVETPVSYKARNYAEGKKIGIRDAFNAMYCIVRYGFAD